MTDEDQAHGPSLCAPRGLVEPLQLLAVRRLRYVVADVFTDTPLTGNQLAVFTDARDLDPLTMQALAEELRFSETVFVLPPQAADADVRIRIFTRRSSFRSPGTPSSGRPSCSAARSRR